MNWRIFLGIFAMAVTAFVGGSPAHAQATRTWVSGVGDDVNPCSRTAPCKTFAGAISKTAVNGEINCLDPAGYGAVTITKSITIDCEDTQGSILSAGSTGVLVNGAGVVVNIRGISINGAATGFNGVRFLQGARLNIEECVIFGSAAAGASNGFGVIVNNTSGAQQLVIRNTVIRNNGTVSTGGGVGIFPTGTGAVRVTLENVMLSGNFRGVDIGATGTSGVIQVMVDSSAVSQNNGGINVAGGTVQLEVRNSTIDNNSGTGIAASGGGSTLLVGNSAIIHNGFGVSATAGAAILSFSDNLLNLNANNGAFTGPAGKS